MAMSLVEPNLDVVEEDEVVEDIFMLLTEVEDVFFTVVLELMVLVEEEDMDLVEDTDLDTCDEDENEEEDVVCTDVDPALWPPDGLITKVLVCFSAMVIL